MNEKIKINIWEVLKDCAMGIRIYSTIFGYVYFIRSEYVMNQRMIQIRTAAGDEHIFDEYGRIYSEFKDAECQLFPDMEMRDWERFNPIVFPYDYFCYASDSPQGPFEIAYYSHYDYKLQRHVCFADSLPQRRATRRVARNYIISAAKFNERNIGESLKFNLYNLDRKFLPL